MTIRPVPLPFAWFAVLVLAVVLPLMLGACSRSPKEQLAFQHAEEQYQINQRNAELARSRPEGDSSRDDERSRERD
ncbi:hypothetical protein E2K99_06820 [Herbaspirillum huttiense]|uniref:Lipoprotein n=2 Tax=Herbaspirillum huttiense TaxID=863372 RepID=A0AAJ2LSP0_9BURK|nr:hypothetical protein [Herbaspirillum huttiense]MBN9356824.1 hypothetical protein [Herbaspirillum huttiense]MDR9835400.1 hypothetical protein [Herbaspirillum huttiense]QBP74741.1 hypothetical protein E2K99_06820 [Herbaspirillum huttiense]